MKIAPFVIAGLFAAMASGASAATYELNFSGPDFNASGPVEITFKDPIGPGHQGYTGGPDQTWGEEINSKNYTGWLDFFPDGKSLRFEGDPSSLGYLFVTSASPFYNLSSAPGPSTPFDLSFLTTNSPVTLTNSGCYGAPIGCPAPGYGSVDTLRISAVPEPATWSLMILGVLGVGTALRSRSGKNCALPALNAA